MSWMGYVCGKLEEYGYGGVEQFLNEWNVEPANRGTARHAAMTAAMMLAAQDSPLTGAMFYDARLGTSIYGGLFNPLTREPFPAYYAFQAFNELYRRGTQLRVSSDTDGVYAAAATNGAGACVVIANTLDRAVPFHLEAEGAEEVLRCRILDGTHPLTCCRLPDTLGPYTVLCVELE